MVQFIIKGPSMKMHRLLSLKVVGLKKIILDCIKTMFFYNEIEIRKQTFHIYKRNTDNGRD